MSMATLSEQELVRRSKLEALKKLAINPYPAALYPVDFFASSLPEAYEEGKKVVVAGRIMSRRIHLVNSINRNTDRLIRKTLWWLN